MLARRLAPFSLLLTAACGASTPFSADFPQNSSSATTARSTPFLMTTSDPNEQASTMPRFDPAIGEQCSTSDPNAPLILVHGGGCGAHSAVGFAIFAHAASSSRNAGGTVSPRARAIAEAVAGTLALGTIGTLLLVAPAGRDGSTVPALQAAGIGTFALAAGLDLAVLIPAFTAPKKPDEAFEYPP